jgi:hypothetical protein
MKYFRVGLVLCLVWLALTSSVQAQDSITLSMADHIRDGRRIGYWIQIQAAGGDPIWVLVDTGSRGLMIMADRLGNAYVQHTGTQVIQTFLDGTVFKGEIVLAAVRMGPVTAARPIPVLAIRGVTCREGLSDCPGKHLRETPLGGVIGIGIGTGKGAMDNPLAYLPGNLASGYIMRGGGPGTPATLTLGLTPANQAGFVFSPVPKQAPLGNSATAFYQQNSTPGCFALGEDEGQYVCGNMLFDSGSSWSFLHVPPQSEPGRALANSGQKMIKSMHLAMPGLPQYYTTIGDVAWTDRFRLVLDKESNSILGAGFFKQFDLLYDLRRQAIAIRPNR